jgi:hypothetical protein
MFYIFLKKICFKQFLQNPIRVEKNATSNASQSSTKSELRLNLCLPSFYFRTHAVNKVATSKTSRSFKVASPYLMLLLELL